MERPYRKAQSFSEGLIDSSRPPSGVEQKVTPVYSAPVSVLADLAGQAILLIDPRTERVAYVSARAQELLCPDDSPVQLPFDLYSLIQREDGLSDRLRLGLSMSSPLSFGLKAVGESERIAANARRLEFANGPPLLLLSLQDEPVLERRFRMLGERILSLNAEIERRRKAEKSLADNSAALGRALELVRHLASIVTSGGDHLALATQAIMTALKATNAAMITKSGGHFVCSARIGPAFKEAADGESLILDIPGFADHEVVDPNAGQRMWLTALSDLCCDQLDPDASEVIPISVASRLDGMLVVSFSGATSTTGMSNFETDLIGQALGSLLARAEMEARLNHSQRLEAIGRLTGGVAHDYNNLLSIILGNAELLENNEPCDQAELVEEIKSAAFRGALLTSQLLAFGRKQTLRPQSTDINQLIQKLRPMIRQSTGDGIDLLVKCSDALWDPVIDTTQLELAILNLTINARDAMPDGGKLTIETANVRLDEAYASIHQDVAPGPYVVVSVSDTGTGMDEHTAKQAFDPFFTTKDVGKGSGLGLSMVYGFVKQSHGHIKIYSEVGHGTTIRMYFPQASFLDSTVEADSVHSDAPTLGRGRVLLVEDDPSILKYIIRVLNFLGYQVDAAHDGESAVGFIDQSDYDLILTDLILPGELNGAAILDYAAKVAPDTPVLCMSGYADNAIIHDRKLSPDVPLISKPFTRNELATKIKGLIKTSDDGLKDGSL